MLVGVILPSDEEERDPLEELRALAGTAGVEVAGEMVQRMKSPRAGTFVGKGKLEELSATMKALGARVAIFDRELSPGQVRAIEAATSAKIIDRSELILDIFASRATTRQAQLQVEIAQLQYTAPRLRAMWKHLGQVTGGAPIGVGTRGPGEQQLEIDRRLVKARLDRLRAELEEVQARKRREVEARRREHFTAGLVGYTNAGKSTLFNALTRGGGAFAHQKLFATLGTRVESWNLGGGNVAMLSDTVGFIRRLPHHLVASFRSTLEDAVHAHLLLVVVDVSDPWAERQLETVRGVLDEIGATTQPRVLVLNKADRLPETWDSRHGPDRRLQEWMEREPDAVVVSARTGEGLDALAKLALDAMRGDVREAVLEIPTSDGRAVDFVERRTEVLGREYEDGIVRLRARIGRRQLEQLLASGSRFLLDGADPRGSLGPGWTAAAEAPRSPPHHRHVGEG